MQSSEPHANAETLSPALPDDLLCDAVKALKKAQGAGIHLATAESCTGGLLASLLTDYEGVGRVFDRGFVTYTDASKSELLDLDPKLITKFGAVSEQVAEAMALGALNKSEASLAIAVTGFTGKGGPSDEPGLVYLSCAYNDGIAFNRECHFGDIGRGESRIATLRAGIAMIHHGINQLINLNKSIDQHSNQAI